MNDEKEMLGRRVANQEESERERAIRLLREFDVMKDERKREMRDKERRERDWGI